MGWQIGGQSSRKRHFSLAPGVDPVNLLPKRPKSGVERQAEGTDHARGVIEPGSPQDPCRQQNLALARILEALRKFPEAFRAVQQVLEKL